MTLWGDEPDRVDDTPAPGWPWMLMLIVLLLLWGYFTPQTLARDEANERARDAQIERNGL